MNNRVYLDVSIIKSTYHLFIARLYNNAVSFFKRIRLFQIKRFCESKTLYHTIMHVFYNPDYRSILERIDTESEEYKAESEECQKAFKLAYRRYLQEMGLYQTDLDLLDESEREALMENLTIFADPEKCKPNIDYVNKMRKKYNLPIRVITDEWVNSVM